MSVVPPAEPIVLPLYKPPVCTCGKEGYRDICDYEARIYPPEQQSKRERDDGDEFEQCSCCEDCRQKCCEEV